MSYEIWRTLFTDDFNLDQYLYHYTSVEKAMKIIFSKELWFSKISKTNDTTESKLRIQFKTDDSKMLLSEDKRTSDVRKYLMENNDDIRLLCFSRDIALSKKELKFAIAMHRNHSKDKYFDISGRGFALPRMWAQYASNHEGICFIINKKKFEDKLKSIAYLRKRDVEYQNFLMCYEIKEKQLNQLNNQVKEYFNGRLSFLELISTDEHFIKYNYFTKQKDWENEREYRYIAAVDGDKELNVKIGGLFDYVEAVVVGEKIDPAYELAIRNMIENRCDIKKIFFSTNMCYVE